MSLTVIIGDSFTAQTYYVNSSGVPFAPTSPTISIFYYNNLGTKVSLVSGAPMVPNVPTDVGRYTYLYSFPGTLEDGSIAYIGYSAIDPISGNNLYSEEQVNLISRPAATGMGYSFVG